ncbi:unnamed protein product [Angiostrongylus costaricensis]|uniref:Uncharacterized protein n=1 Tax=Angiostrongylus costaricensis TaxID=334426 RepID=A0A0R3PJL7_ANGCS|nr:unnamed protein product [Angiostrongylus costaricensis]
MKHGHSGELLEENARLNAQEELSRADDIGLTSISLPTIYYKGLNGCVRKVAISVRSVVSRKAAVPTTEDFRSIRVPS